MNDWRAASSTRRRTPPPQGNPIIRSASGTRTLLLSSCIGTVIEWYDFFVFASAAALVFDRVFFPRVDPRTGVLLALMTYAVGFATRPLGGIVFGWIGDRFGRKRALVGSLTLMGCATVGVGLVPGYATIGFAAPLLLVLLRLIQGIAVGGEVGGALLMVVEGMPPERRGLWTGFPMIGGAGGNLLSTGALALLGALLGETAFASWGWRIAFVASGALIGVGIWIRARVDESPLYREYVARRAGQPRVRLGATLLAHRRSILIVLLVKAGENALFYVFSTFFVVYVTRVLHRPLVLALEGMVVSSVAEIVTIFAAGAWSDRIGRRPVTALGLVTAAVWSFLLFPIAAHGTPTAVIVAAGIGGVCHGTIVGGMSAFFVELFPTAARYTGFSLGYQLATVFSGAVAPLIGVALLNAYGSTLPVSLYAVAMAGPALVSLGIAPETRGAELAE
jgi:MFS family permease